MESTYLTIEHEVIRRRRRLNTLQGLRTGVMIALIATLIYLAAVYLGFLEMVRPWWILVAFNLLAAWIGARHGRRRSIALQNDLYRVDRALGLDEKLATIYELRQRSGDTDFLMALYQRLQGLVIDPVKALPYPRSERRAWLGLGSLALAASLFLGLWFVGIPPFNLMNWLSSLSASGSSSIELLRLQKDPMNDPLAAAEERHHSNASEDSRAQTGAEGSSHRSSSPCLEPEGQSRVTEDQASASQCDATAGRGSPDSSPTASDGGSRSDLQRLSQELSELKQQLERGELSADELQKRLEQLAEGAPSPEVQQTLRQAGQSQNREEMRRQLEEALSQLQRSLQEGRAASNSNTAQNSSSSADSGENTPASSSAGGDQAAQGESQPTASQSDSQGEGASPSASEQEATGSGENSSQDQAASSGGQPGTEEHSGNNSGSESDEASSEGEASQSAGDADRASGDGTGQEPGQDARTTSQGRLPPGDKDLLINQGLLPRDAKMLESLLTKGIPMDLVGQPSDGTPTLRLNLERVEALLALRDLPPELRNLVRAYFLAIAGE